MLEHDTHQSTFLQENGNGRKNDHSKPNGNGSNGAGKVTAEPRRGSMPARNKREELLETIRTAQAELELLNQWNPGDRVLVPGICEGISDEVSGRVMVRLDGVARSVELPEELLQKVGTGVGIEEEAAAVRGEAEVVAVNPQAEEIVNAHMEPVGDNADPLPRTVSGVGSINRINEARRRLEILRQKRHADHRDLPCGACEAETILELLEGVVALPEVVKWPGVKANGSWVDISEVGRRRLVAIEKDSALQLAAALIAAAEAVEG